MKILIFTLLCFLSIESLAKAPQYSFSQDVKLYFSNRKLNENINPFSSTTDLILLGSSDVIAQMDQFRVELKPELRMLAGNSNQLSDFSPSLIHLESPNRAIDTRWHLGSREENVILYGDWERMNLTYQNETAEIYVGRKAVSLGVLKYFPVWNKFSKPLPGVTTIPILFGSDGFGGRVQLDQWAISASQLIYEKGRDLISFAEVVNYNDFAELHALIGSWWTQTVFGFAFSKDILGANLNFEFLNYEKNSQMGLGIDHALSESTSINFELFYQSAGVTSTLDYNPLLSSHFQSLQANFYSWLVIQYQITPLWIAHAGGLTNWIDKGTALNLGMTYSLSDHFDFSVEGLLSISRPYAEFSNRSFEFSDGTHFGLPSQLIAHLDWNF